MPSAWNVLLYCNCDDENSAWSFERQKRQKTQSGLLVLAVAVTSRP